MTITTDPTTAYDELGAEIEPGTLCWVKTDDSVPSVARDKRCLAVFTGDIGSQPWLLLIPVAKPEDPWSSNSESGWRLHTHVTGAAMNTLNLNRFAETHRGWWVPRSNIQFLETAVGYWCIEHQVFHAAETCPTGPDRERIAELERQLAKARADVEETRIKGEQALEDFKVRCSDILASEANDHDLCGVYDQVCEDAGLYPRPHDEDVEIEITYRQTVTVKARNYGDAEAMVKAKAATNYFTPPCPFTDESDIDLGGSYSLSVTIAD